MYIVEYLWGRSARAAGIYILYIYVCVYVCVYIYSKIQTHHNKKLVVTSGKGPTFTA